MQRITGELAELAETAAQDARTVAGQRPPGVAPGPGQGRRAGRGRSRDAAAGRRRGRLVRAVNDLTELLDGDRARSPRRPGSGSPGPRRTARPGGSACTTRTPGRSPRAGSVNRSSSATRPRSSTTTTASCWTTTSSSATRPTHPTWRRPSNGSEAAPTQSPRTVTADRGYGEAASRTTCVTWASAPW